MEPIGDENPESYFARIETNCQNESDWKVPLTQIFNLGSSDIP